MPSRAPGSGYSGVRGINALISTITVDHRSPDHRRVAGSAKGSTGLPKVRRPGW